MSLTKVSPEMVDIGLLIDAVLPAGIILDWPGSNLPAGRWLWCDGGESSRSGDTAALFSVCGENFGPGDGTTTFNRPDLRGRVSAGTDAMGGSSAGRLTGATLGATLGVESVTLTAAQSGLPAHTHTATSTPSLTTASSGAHTHTVANAVTSVAGAVDVPAGTTATAGTATTSSDGAHTHTVSGTVSTTVNSVSASAASASHTNVQPTQVYNKIIKY